MFGPAGAYPYEANLRYKPPHAPLAEYMQLAKLLGIERCWVKFTGTYRMGTTPTFADKVGSVQLFNLLADWAPDAATRQKILADNGVVQTRVTL